jgi:hypothetical protein
LAPRFALYLCPQLIKSHDDHPSLDPPAVGFVGEAAPGLDPEVNTGSRRNQIYADGVDLPAMENRVETALSLMLMS